MDDTARRMGGTVSAGDPATVWDGAVLDSRKVAGGELFFALPGERTDGHRFVGAAFEAGAAAAVVERDVPLDGLAGRGCLIRVADTYEGLHALTRSLRSEAPETLVAVTGSAGKTTTKELLAAMCARRFRTARNPGNLNNLFGFPVSFLSIPEGTEVMVAELGMSVAGEMAAVSRLARPDGAVLTNVRPAHLENFPDVAAIAEAKAEVFQGLAGDGAGRPFVVANGTDPEVVRVTRRWQAETGGRVVWFGLAEAALPEGPALDVRARDLAARSAEPGAQAGATGSHPASAGASEAPGPAAAGAPAVFGTRFVLELGDEALEAELPLHGGYNVENALAAAAAARELGVGAEDVRRALGVARPEGHRGAVHPLEGGGLLVDDAYNSNPDALARALRGAAELPGTAGGRRLAILGDMLELGPGSPRFHREAGARAARLGFTPVAGVGELARELVAGAREAGAEAEWLPDAGAAADWAARRVRPGDLVLVKGSRGVGLERVAEELLEARGAREEVP
ncbi:MAG: UDP-N-acetylmuramoyl-tripeptide--D-alanyl-D-alanine ligase [Thermoanaerobaculia bacterium]